MDDYPYLSHLLNSINLILMIDKPAFVKNISTVVDFEEIGKIEDETILMGIVRFYVEADTSFRLDYTACTEEFTDEESREDAEFLIADQLEWFLEMELKEHEEFYIWDDVDFENGDWKK